MFLRILAALILAGCSSNKPTPYHKEKKDFGYSDDRNEGLRVSTFKGNAYTSVSRAKQYAEFRAVEVCLSEDFHANIIDVYNKTIEKEITRSSGTAWGPGYFGSYPYYSRYSSFGIGASFNTMSSNTWSDTLSYPVIQVLYRCNEQIYRPEVIFRELSADQIKHLVKDVKGAIQVEKIPPASPNLNTIEYGDIVLRAQGHRITQVQELIRLFDHEHQKIRVEVLRDGVKKNLTLKSRDMTNEVMMAEKEIVTKVCRMKKNNKEKDLKDNKLCK